MHHSDRFQHVYIIGQSGTGKTSLLESMILQDIHNGNGVAYVEPHGDSVDRIYSKIPEYRKEDVIYINCTDPANQYRYNPLKYVHIEKRSLVASGVMEVMKSLWSDAWGVRLEHILRNIILTLLDIPNSSIANIMDMLFDKEYRNKAIQRVQNPYLKTFWKKEFPQYMRHDLLPVANKIGGLLAHPVIRRILVENPNEISLRRSIDSRKIILVNVARGSLGEDASRILGALFTTSLASASYSRVDTPEESRVPFFHYADEFQHTTSSSDVQMLSELRKFKVGMTMAHQYLKQIDTSIHDAIMGNVGTMLTFRVGIDDARLLSKRYYPVFTEHDIIELPNYNFITQLMIKGVPSKPFNAITIAPE
jgi:hypothetical protein